MPGPDAVERIESCVANTLHPALGGTQTVGPFDKETAKRLWDKISHASFDDRNLIARSLANIDPDGVIILERFEDFRGSFVFSEVVQHMSRDFIEGHSSYIVECYYDNPRRDIAKLIAELLSSNALPHLIKSLNNRELDRFVLENYLSICLDISPAECFERAKCFLSLDRWNNDEEYIEEMLRNFMTLSQEAMMKETD